MKKSYIILFISIIYIFSELFIFIFVNNTQFKILFYSKNFLTEKNYNQFILERDKILGWPKRNADFSTKGFIPRSKASFNDYCISIYGDSFAYSADVDEQYSWSEITERNLNCNVSNFAVGGYGLYQSFLRYKINSKYDKSKVIVLNHTTENIARIVNQYRELIYQNQIYGFKPTVYLSDENLLINVPIVSFSSYKDYVSNIKNINKEKFKHEYYLPEYKSSNFEFKFPFTYSFFNALFKHHRIKDKINNRPWYSQHYENKKNVFLTYKIIEKFIKTVESNNKYAVVNIIPTCRDFEYFKKNNKFVYKPLVDLLDKKNIYYIDFGKFLIEREDFKNFKNWYNNCSGHPNKYGYKLFSEVFIKSIKKNIKF